ncbi:hypothetical protein SAMN04490240_4084 [Rhodococcus pyridinivorans]|uniref:hypothetical protein n=1 Tax=Rhodococcus pyridinivorans TaxID=103816 RepID=UPI0007CD6DB5|nr:hypothetical protein [Rhodococcus pyridinivorans]SED51564.1 hypothetical protein SAMN04490240_4084 [Rhodococcus pyridinivorans]
MTDRDGYYLPRHDQDKLIELLDQIPDLIEDLTIAISRQDRIAGGGPRTRNGSDEQPIPIGLHAMEAADLLHHTLTAWTNHVCEQRNYPRPRNDTLTLAAWLKRWIIALALTEGSEEAPHDIRLAVRQARQAVDRPREKHIERPPDESLDAVGLTKDELREAIYARTGQRIPRKHIDNWIRREHITTIEPGYYSLPSALDYLARRDQEKMSA